MAPQEKAKELLDKMSNQTFTFQEYAGAHLSTEIVGWEAGKKCAMVVVDEILNSIVPKNEDERLVYELCGNQFYWKDVKKELGKL